jgi:hypothetical protein
MAGVPSPDLPAYACYAIVLLVGLVVARSSVNDLLAASPDHWAFPSTWSLFFAYVLVPVLLFWFLDYTGAIRDTSLFAALLVAAGYRQIFAGGVQGITMPGQTPSVWKPFEAWAKTVADRIATRNKLYTDRFNERVRNAIVSDPTKLAAFEELAFERAKDANALQAAITPYKATPAPPGAALKLLDALWRSLRESEPENYGYLLYKRHLVSRWQHWRWLENGRAKLLSAAVALTCALLAIFSYVWINHDAQTGFGHWENATIKYHQWRFLKGNASERDRWRSHEFLLQEIRRSFPDDVTDGCGVAATRSEHPPIAARTMSPSALDSGRRLQAICLPLIRELRYSDVLPRQAEDATRLLVDCHSASLDSITVPALIESLRTPNHTVRLLINRTLAAIQKADYDATKPDETLNAWVPSKDESPGDIDGHVQAWYRWWHRTVGPTAHEPLSQAARPS